MTRTPVMYDGIHTYRRSDSGLVEHAVNDGNDLPLIVLGEVERLLGWPTAGMVECETEDGSIVLVGCDTEGHIVEVNVTEEPPPPYRAAVYYAGPGADGMVMTTRDQSALSDDLLIEMGLREAEENIVGSVDRIERHDDGTETEVMVTSEMARKRIRVDMWREV